MLEITCNDRLGKKVRVKCNADDTIGDLKKLIAAQTGTKYDKIVLKKWWVAAFAGIWRWFKPKRYYHAVSISVRG